MLVAIGNILNLLSTRLGRLVDRARHLQQRHRATFGAEHDMVVTKIRAIDERIALIAQAIRNLVVSGLSIGMTAAILFVEEMARYPLDGVAAGFFLISIGLLMWALVLVLVLVLRETRVAAANLRIPRDFLELHRKDI